MRSERKASADIIRMTPQSALLYREAVRDLNATLIERQEARALIAELLGGAVKVRQDGDAVYARLETEAGRTTRHVLEMTSSMVAGACYAMSRRSRNVRD